MRTLAISLAISLILVACATAGKIKGVKLGMTRPEVVSVMGEPNSVSAKGNTVYLNYDLSATSDQAFYGVTRPYFVRLVDGHVDSFGATGDFDSTKTPAIRIEGDQNKTDTPCDLYTELTKLKKLEDGGIITQGEFENEKGKLLSRCK